MHQAEPGPDVIGPSTCAVHQLFFPPSPRYRKPLFFAAHVWASCSEDCNWPARLRGQLGVLTGCPFHVLAGEHPLTLLVTKAWDPLCLGPVPESLCSLFSRVKEAVDLRVMRC